ncbi:MAG: 2-succinyl-5-enolpyruvyl-6-hydroxy-3-cyclohexene-1-carboxylic-acid synthase, partial [Solirubrobacteraceae bacterium]
MTSATGAYELLGAFVDELARCGMRDACTSPGSRCTPLVLSLARDERLRCHSHVDERCAGFFALGLAKASGRPVTVACTSGTAVAELLPAVVEAYEARVPLIVLSADRPPELRELGSGQTIDQLKIFGAFAKWFFEVGTHDATAERIRWMRTLACRAFWTALEGRPGVVHLNFALRDPLVCDEAPAPAREGRSTGAPFVGRRAQASDSNAAAHELRESIGPARRGVLVAGRHERETPLG